MRWWGELRFSPSGVRFRPRVVRRPFILEFFVDRLPNLCLRSSSSFSRSLIRTSTLIFVPSTAACPSFTTTPPPATPKHLHKQSQEALQMLMLERLEW